MTEMTERPAKAASAAESAKAVSRVPMRDRIIAAAIEVIADQGVAAATTKEIARTAAVSEGSLYNHFANKNALIAATMAELAGGIREAMMRLFAGAGTEPLAESLARLGTETIEFYRRMLPVTGPVLGDPGMLAHVRTGTADHGVGPLRGQEALAGFFAGEQAAGRVAAGADPQTLAGLLLGACHQYAFMELLCGAEQVAAAGLPGDAAVYARGVAEAVCRAGGVAAG